MTSAELPACRCSPSWRNDLETKEDLTEEIARLVGYDNIPATLPVAPPGRGLTRTQQQKRRVVQALADFGLTEVLSYPFVSKSANDTLVPSCPLVCELLNSFWIDSSFGKTLASAAGWFTSQSFCGIRRIRAPFAPPRLSEPRKEAADAQAVATSSEIVSPDLRIFALRAAISGSPINL